MKKLIFSCLALSVWWNVSAQKKETFNFATYTIPIGYTKSVKEGLVSYTSSNESKGSFCIINIYSSIESLGTIDEEFATYWKEVAAVPFNIK